ncbi:MAG TPA: bifunctional demethylmenaquinone methyltransferase/2-methoxy-6-polyprenyl-1,4-benzoquinol methylase UbiE [Terriglobales bacterium]|nr:bifunctional demethylmenaquinone methyltransferase/2-methoxy-6-polyprenyl-1,4-benzoquinol methylase UbiE [Terriglobales bacterium]
MAEAAAPSKGSRPPGVATESDAGRKVREMFAQIAPRYDLLNHLLSFQLDRLWRARTARILKPILDRPDAVVLDLCCGTGDLAMALSHNARARVIGADFAHPMLVRAAEKAATKLHPVAENRIRFLETDALCLPFAGATFDLITTAFGFRNLANYEAGLREIRRVLKPRGTLAILEFTEPPEGFLGNLYRWYFCKVLPRIGGIISRNPSAYSYLPQSVSRFFRPNELTALLCSLGFEEAQVRVWTFGTLALHTARRAE